MPAGYLAKNRKYLHLRVGGGNKKPPGRHRYLPAGGYRFLIKMYFRKIDC